jgi:hypothetical protein
MHRCRICTGALDTAGNCANCNKGYAEKLPDNITFAPDMQIWPHVVVQQWQYDRPEVLRRLSALEAENAELRRRVDELEGKA